MKNDHHEDLLRAIIYLVIGLFVYFSIFLPQLFGDGIKLIQSELGSLQLLDPVMFTIPEEFILTSGLKGGSLSYDRRSSDRSWLVRKDHVIDKHINESSFVLGNQAIHCVDTFDSESDETLNCQQMLTRIVRGGINVTKKKNSKGHRFNDVLPFSIKLFWAEDFNFPDQLRHQFREFYQEQICQFLHNEFTLLDAIHSVQCESITNLNWTIGLQRDEIGLYLPVDFVLHQMKQQKGALRHIAVGSSSNKAINVILYSPLHLPPSIPLESKMEFNNDTGTGTSEPVRFQFIKSKEEIKRISFQDSAASNSSLINHLNITGSDGFADHSQFQSSVFLPNRRSSIIALNNIFDRNQSQVDDLSLSSNNDSILGIHQSHVTHMLCSHIRMHLDLPSSREHFVPDEIITGNREADLWVLKDATSDNRVFKCLSPSERLSFQFHHTVNQLTEALVKLDQIFQLAQQSQRDLILPTSFIRRYNLLIKVLNNRKTMSSSVSVAEFVEDLSREVNFLQQQQSLIPRMHFPAEQRLAIFGPFWIPLLVPLYRALRII